MNHIVRIGACQTPEIISEPFLALDVMLQFAKEAEVKNVDLLLFPECFLTGYILDKAYVAEFSYDFESGPFAEILKRLRAAKPTLVFGANEKKPGKYFNSALVVDRGGVTGVYRKTHLLDPNETSIYTPGGVYPVFEIKGLRYGINICYDAQFPEAARAVADKGARLLLLPAQNMLWRETAERWRHRHGEIGAERVKETGLWLARSDVTGIRPPGKYGEERVAYGPTQIINPESEIAAQVPLMAAGMVAVDIPSVYYAY